MSGHRRILRIGRMGRWHRRLSHVLLAACAASGLVWFVLMDALHWEPPRMVAWWTLHGLSALAAWGVIGAALPHHVPLAWSHARNRRLGGCVFALLALLSLSAAALLYGKEDWRTAAHWLHVLAGCAAIGAFVAHVLVGRRSVGRLPAHRRARADERRHDVR